MYSGRKQSSPSVKSGKQYRSERSSQTPPDHNTPHPFPQICRQHAGKGFCHVLMVRDVRMFLSVLPDWGTLSQGLNMILLAPARPNCDGFHRPGLVAVCAQSRNFSHAIDNPAYVRQHRDILDRLGVPIEQTDAGHILHFTRSTLRAFQLLHVLLHELGHHHDRMTTRSQKRSARGEPFAEAYARAYGDRIWAKYFETVPPS